jgi:hypothetical protein
MRLRPVRRGRTAHRAGGQRRHPPGSGTGQPVLAALSLHGLHLLFYLTLTLMLGAFFKSRGPVLAIPIAILIGQGILESLGKPLAPWFPWHILPAKLPGLAGIAALGEPLPSCSSIVSALLFSLVFVLLAIWRFEREEF